jgi:signal peptide peptidase SppA
MLPRTLAPFLADRPLAIELAVLERMVRTPIPDAAALEAAVTAWGEADREPVKGSAIGVLQLRGAIKHHAGGGLFELFFGGGASVDRLAEEFRALLGDESVRAIVLDVDSPGGTVPGVPEFAQEIYESRGVKPIVAIANATMASAAYWIGTAADELYVTPSGRVGSVGVYVAHEDWSKFDEEMGVKTTLISAGKYKVEGNPYEPLGDEATAFLQHSVDLVYGRFVDAVAAHRGVSSKQVIEGYGQGRVLEAEDAVKAGMVDGVRTLDEVIDAVGLSAEPSPAAAASSGRFTYAQHAEHARAGVQAFVSRTRSLAGLRANDGRPLGAAARATLAAFLEGVQSDIQQVEVLTEDPDRDRELRAWSVERLARIARLREAALQEA